MARFDIEGIDDLMNELNYLDVERIAPMMLEEAEPILKKEVVKQVEKHKDTGDLVKSIKTTGAERTKNGYYLAVRPTGKDRKGVRNMEKLAYLEYGTGREAARPVLTKAVHAAEDEVIKKMQEVYDRETKG